MRHSIYNRRTVLTRCKGWIIIVPVVFLLLFPLIGMSFAQDANAQGKNTWLLGVLFKLEKMRDGAVADIRKCERNIRESESTIGKAEDILGRARQAGNALAENIALQAITTARKAKRMNEKNKSLAELRKRRAEWAIANVRNLAAKALAMNSGISSVVTDYTGRVEIDRPGETIPIDENHAGYLEPGDTIRTYDNSSVEMRFLDGRGTLKLGADSQLKMEEDSTGAQILDMLKGKVHIADEKMDEYKEKMNEKYSVRTPAAVAADRGTEFLVFVDDVKGTELVVLDGSVEMKGTNGGKAVIVNAGQKATCAKDGMLSGPEGIDLTAMDKWWKE